MALKRYDLNIGKRMESIELPEEHVVQVIDGGSVSKITDIKQATLEAVRNPIGTQALSKLVHEGDKVALIVSDITRTWSRTKDYLPAVVEELNNSGIPDADIFVIIATGTHRDNDDEEKSLILGDALFARLQVFDHDAYGAEANVFLGTTSRGTPVYIDKRAVEADKVILTGGITTHLFAGFGGGRKSVMPGLAGVETIKHNHLLALTDEVGGGVNQETYLTKIEGNRVSEDMCEVCAFLNPCFLVNSIMDAEGDFVRIVAGHWYDAWYAGTQEVMKLQGVEAKAKADVVIGSSGGYPMDINLYQGMKSYAPAQMAMQPNGIFIALLDCPDIYEPPSFFDCFRFNDELSMEKELRAGFTIPFYIAFYMYCMSKQFTVIMVTRTENFDAVRRTGQIPAATLAEAWTLAQKKLMAQGKAETYTVNIMPHGVNTVPMFK